MNWAASVTAVHGAAALTVTRLVRTNDCNHLFLKLQLFRASMKIFRFSDIYFFISLLLSWLSVLWGPRDRSPSHGSLTTWSTVNTQQTQTLHIWRGSGCSPAPCFLTPTQKEEGGGGAAESHSFDSWSLKNKKNLSSRCIHSCVNTNAEVPISFWSTAWTKVPLKLTDTSSFLHRLSATDPIQARTGRHNNPAGISIIHAMSHGRKSKQTFPRTALKGSTKASPPGSRLLLAVSSWFLVA